jgi:site-specific recombinase XerD
LIVSLTHLLTRTKSFYASGERARSRGAVVVLAHSPGCRAQNSTHLANQGVDTRLLQHYLGHKNIQHTVRYSELSPERFRDFWKD